MNEKHNIFSQEVLNKYSNKIPRDYSNEQLKKMYEDKCIVAFVDILGFSTMIQEDPKGEEFIPILEKAIEEALQFANSLQIGGNISDVEYRIFSDNICFWIPLKAHTASVALMFGILSEFQLCLIKNKILCRGAVTIGYHYASNYMLYGPALVEAVKLENSTKTPCISISEYIMEKIHLINFPLKMHQFHKLSKTGPWFINYLSKIFYIKKEDSLKTINLHFKILKEKTLEYQNSPDILEKYSWLSRYHNDIVKMIKFMDECPKIKNIGT